MMFLKKSLSLVFTVIVLCESGFVENLAKCNINDGDCQNELITTILHDISKTGIPELGIPNIDPLKLSNVSVSILNSLDITLVEGNLKGIKNCIVEKFVTNIEKEHSSMELKCDVSVKGHYKVNTYSPAIKNLFGGQTVHGDGNAKVKIEKLHMKFDFFFFIQRRNGELYIKCKSDKILYSYEIGKMTFFADNLYLGNQESSKLVTGLLNQNWRSLMEAFGKPFMDKAMSYVYIYIHKFIDTTPAKYFIADDVSSYARDEL